MMSKSLDELANLSPESKRELLLLLLQRKNGSPAPARPVLAMAPPPVPFRPPRPCPLDEDLYLDIEPPAHPGSFALEPLRPLLTGATGFLGAFILAELLRRTRATVHCLVRAANPAEGKARIRANLDRYQLWTGACEERVVPVVGDLSEPRLGLGAEFEKLADTVDGIYHVAASVNFLLSYQELKPASVDGTRQILALACTGPLKAVHFVSSLSVFVCRPFMGRVVTEMELPRHGDQLDFGGYAQVKWVSDWICTMARSTGLPVSIYRPAFIGWHSETGAFNEDDFLCRLILGSIQMGVAPDIDLLLHTAPVDYVSGALVELSRNPAAVGSVHHLVHSDPITLRELVSLMQQSGIQVDLESYPRWRSRLSSAPRENVLKVLEGLFPTAPRPADSTSVIDLLAPGRLPTFEAARTRAMLADSGLRCPPLGQILRPFLGSLEERGLFSQA